jgi:membrane-associated HD superfamily phosphohydrolase
MKGIFQNLRYNGKEKLGKLSLLLLLMLDIFVFISINYGLDFQREVISNPDVEWSSECRGFTNSEDLNTSIYNYYYYDNSYYYDEDIYKNELNPQCAEILDVAKNVGTSQKLSNLKIEISTVERAKIQIEDDIYSVKHSYDTTLFEKIAGQDENKSILEDGLSADNIKSKILKLEANLQKRTEDIEILYEQFYNDEVVLKLKEVIEKNREIINSEWENSSRFYSSKVYLVEFAFTIPLVLIFYFLMLKYRKEENFIQYTAMKHLFIVSIIPFLVISLDFIYEYLPKEFLGRVVKFFYSIELPFLVYYFLIAIAVVFAVSLIIYIQKLFKKRDKNGLTRVESYRKSECVNCGNRVNYSEMSFCPFCGETLKDSCNSCGEKKLKGLNYCENCGNSENEN